MRKSILALIWCLSLLTMTSILMIPLPNDQVTIVPFSGELFPGQATPRVVPTSLFTPEPAGAPVRGSPPLSLTLILLGLCCFFLLFIGMFILGFVLRNQNMKEWTENQQSPPQ